MKFIIAVINLTVSLAEALGGDHYEVGNCYGDTGRLKALTQRIRHKKIKVPNDVCTIK
ncbi:MAG: hypothetical protein ABI041_18745 [Bdellovibrionia bacterium]